jgi:MFS family permease
MASVVSGILGTVAAGKASDHLGRKQVLAWCMVGACALTGLCGLFRPSMAIPKVLVAASFFQGSMRPIIAALVMDLCPAGQRRDGYALSYLGINLGLAVGPMLAGFLFERHLSWTFFGYGLAMCGALAILLRLVPADRPRSRPRDEAGPGNAFQAFLGRPALVAYSLISLFVSFAYAQTGFGLTLYTSERFGVRGAPVFGLLMSFNAVVVLALTTGLTAATRRLTGPLVMGIGTALYSVGFGMMAFRLDLKLLLLSTLIWSVGEVLLFINTGAYIADHTPEDLRGRFQSICEVMSSLGRILSPVVFGAVIAGVGVRLSWLITALVTLACTAAFHAWDAREISYSLPK